MPPKITDIDKLYRNIKKKEKEQKIKASASLSSRKVPLTISKQFDDIEDNRERLVRNILKNIDNAKNIIENYEDDEDFKIVLQSFSRGFLENLIREYIAKKDADKSLPRETKKIKNTLDYFKNILLDEEGAPQSSKRYQKNLEELAVKTHEDVIKEIRKDFIKTLRKNYNTIDRKLVVKLVNDIQYDRELVNALNTLDIDEIKYVAKNIKKDEKDIIEYIMSIPRERKLEVEQKRLPMTEDEKLLDELKISMVYDEKKKVKEKKKEKEEDELPYVYTGKREEVKDIEIIVDEKLKRQFEETYKRFKQENQDKKKEDEFFIMGFDNRCYAYQLYKPWIWRYVSTWISSDNEKVISKYSIPMSEPLVVNGVKYYHVNKLFNILQCTDTNRKMKTQNKNILTLYEPSIKKTPQSDEKKIELGDYENTPIQVEVVHLLENNKVLFQDEELFKKEMDYLRVRSILEKKNEILNSFNLPNELISYSKDRIRRYFNNLPLRRSVKTTSEELDNYIDKIVESIRNRIITRKDTARVFIQAIADILLYLDERMLRDYSTNFQLRLLNMFYRPEKIMDLSKENKFEELYKNKLYDDDLKNVVSQRIEYYSNIHVDEITERVLKNINKIYKKGREFDKFIEPMDLSITDIRKQCKNRDVLDEDLSDYMIYKEEETGDIYCISLYNIGTVNPYTGKPYPLYVQKELEQLDSQVIGNHFDELLFGTEPGDDLTPGLMDIVFKNIKLMEEKIFKEDSTVDYDKKCEYCQKHIKPGNVFETVIKHDDDSEVIAFCKLKCFEDWEVKDSKKKRK